MIKNRPAPRWLIAFTAVVVLCTFVLVVYVGWIAYQIRNTTPFERDSEQYNGWMYADGNKLTNANDCVDDGGWAEMGIVFSDQFTAGCREWFKSR